MKAVEAIIIIAILAYLVMYVLGRYVVAPAVRAIKARRRASEPWKVIEDEEGTATVVLLVKPGEEHIQIGSAVPHNLPHWEYAEAIEERWADAEARADEKNRRLSV